MGEYLMSDFISVACKAIASVQGNVDQTNLSSVHLFPSVLIKRIEDLFLFHS